MIAAPDCANNTHLNVLSRLSTLLMDNKFRESLINAADTTEFLRLINIKETEKFGDETARKEKTAEALQNKTDELGISCKVVTNGPNGTKNGLTKEDIENYECIIVTADKNVEMTRFDGKKAIITKVANGIHKAEELVTKAAAGDAPIYHASSATSGVNSETSTSESLSRQLYKHLINGVSHMLPFVIGGGLLVSIIYQVIRLH